MRRGRLCGTAADLGKRFQQRADIYIEDMPIYCSDINRASHRLNALNCVTEGIHNLKPQNEPRLDTEKRLQRHKMKNNHPYLLCSTLFFNSALHTEEIRSTTADLPLDTWSGKE